ncbi:MAG: beta-N-acetylhexosaminidase [Sphingomonadales bacterium]|nr:beta-N-acetylhexosaminidase [Sphingomonadales bacterium]
MRRHPVTLPAIFGLAGPVLGDGERAFFRDADPAGYILFARNCADPGQLRALTDALRALAGRELPILIDQEGGRVARLKPPHWPLFPPAEAFARLYRVAPMSAIEAARANAGAMGLLLREAGVTMNCAPVLDLRHEGAHDIIGDRAFGPDPMQVAALGRATLDGLAAAGVAGCIKHIPGHGRAGADSHKERPVIAASKAELEADFAPFRSLRSAPAAMVAHVVYAALDPDRPASQSPVVVDIIREEIGFGGLLVSDDIAMDALAGSPAERAHGVVAAGCDLALHCSGDLAGMEGIAAALPALSDAARERLDLALRPAPPPSAADWEMLAAKRDALLAYAEEGDGLRPVRDSARHELK